MTTDWFLGGASHGVKRIHREGCRYAGPEYLWAHDLNEDQLCGELIETGAWRWHRGCRLCCADIDDVLHPAPSSPEGNH